MKGRHPVFSTRWSRRAAAAVLVAALGAGCSSATGPQAKGPAGGLESAHLPPIECPLHKAGIDPTKLQPFEKVEKYIQFLERPDRAKWQKPDEVVAALGLKGSETVVDLGAGSGYFTFRMARVLPKGKVVAIDCQPEMIRHIHHKAMSDGIANVEARIAKPDDPGIPPKADLVFVCDVLHHVANRSEWLKKLHAEMASGARLVLIEFRSGKLPEGPPAAVKIPKAKLISLLAEAGFTLQEDRADLLPYQEYLVFVKPRSSS
jgi:SAM-dependent methyltransferase